eukprot:333958-Chlamydomonas_euryale.AAC.1
MPPHSSATDATSRCKDSKAADAPRWRLVQQTAPDREGDQIGRCRSGSCPGNERLWEGEGECERAAKQRCLCRAPRCRSDRVCARRTRTERHGTRQRPTATQMATRGPSPPRVPSPSSSRTFAGAAAAAAAAAADATVVAGAIAAAAAAATGSRHGHGAA